jgi:disulfide bond formation protein DsbB
MRLPFRAFVNHWTLTAACASAAMLAAAHAFENFGGLLPCHLCLYQRDVYWAALSVGVAGFLLGYMRLGWVGRLATIMLALIFLLGAGVAAYHAGVEWKWWPGPASCSGGGQVNAGDLASFLAGAKAQPPRCDQAAWVMLGLSMAGWNCLISLALAALSALAARREPRHDEPHD